MDVRKLTPFLSVSPQITAADVGTAAAMGFKTIICNRPANESEDQPDLAEIEKACELKGIVWHHQPVISGQITDEDVDAFAAYMAQVQGPVLAFCRSGARCTSLWALSEAANMAADSLLETAKSAGYDLTGLRPRLEAENLEKSSSKH